MDIDGRTWRDISILIHRFYWLVDHGRAGEAAEMFTEDASLIYGEGSPAPGELRGDAIRAAMKARQEMATVTSRHLVSNLLLTLSAGDRIDSTMLLTVFRSDDPSRNPIPHTIADVEESFVRDGGCWRIDRRMISPVFVRS